MGYYKNGGHNEIGVAVSPVYAAVWALDTPFIDVIQRDFFDVHEGEILEALRRGEGFSDSQGRKGAVHAIGTAGDLDENGSPIGFDTAADYVLAELASWMEEDGADFVLAELDGYMR